MRNKKLVPFLKWPGGKRWFISRHISILPSNFNHYFEPFVGGGSVYFNIAPSKATISDINADLIDLYIVMRDFPSLLKDALEKHQKKHSKEYYYRIREKNFDDKIERASRFLYLNRACYNGMYRVNKNGKFNVPIGTKTNFIYDIDTFDLYSNILRNTDITHCDFSTTIKKAKSRDLIFADPPYTIAHNQNSFIKYNETLFTWSDQERLLRELISARERGAMIVSTNANYKDIFEMYADNKFYINIIQRYSAISGGKKGRGMTEELVISSFDPHRNQNAFQATMLASSAPQRPRL